MTVDQIIRVAGGINKLAEIAGVSRCSVYDWRRTQRVPIKRARRIHERLSIPLHEIRPDVWSDPAITDASADAA